MALCIRIIARNALRFSKIISFYKTVDNHLSHNSFCYTIITRLNYLKLFTVKYRHRDFLNFQ